MELEIAFTTRRDGVHIAYGTMGQGPPIVYPPGAFSRLELEMRRGADFFDALAKDHTLVSWDRHGVGHSDRNRTDFTFEDDVLDMEAVIDALKLDRFPVFGISDGGPIAIKYASRHLERVSCLVLYGTAASNESNAPARHALAELMRNDWWLGMRSTMLRFVPSTPDEAVGPMAQLLSETSTAEIAASIFEMNESVRDLLPQIAQIPSDRELEVLRLLAAGKSNQQIADEQVISLNTVNRHVSNIYAKTGAANRAEAATYAARNGIS